MKIEQPWDKWKKPAQYYDKMLGGGFHVQYVVSTHHNEVYRLVYNTLADFYKRKWYGRNLEPMTIEEARKSWRTERV